MHQNTIKNIINRLNNNKAGETIFLRPLSTSVSLGKVWIKKPHPKGEILSPDGPDTFYFIKDDNGRFVGSVYDMYSDLHWYVLPKHRKMGYLSKSLKDAILPHIFQQRDNQRITINKAEIGAKNFGSSESVALKLGFVKFKEDREKAEYQLTNEPYRNAEYNDGGNTPMSKERLKQLQKRLNYLSRSLWVLQTEVDMMLGDHDYSEELKELVDELRNHTIRIENAWHMSS